MQVGHFFELDKNSFLHKGEVVFRYLRVKSNDTHPLYPVYLSFSSHRIDFYFHGFLYNKVLKKYEFIETILFSLPLSTHETVVNELNKKLEEIYPTQFPFLFNYSINGDEANEKEYKVEENEIFKIIDEDIPSYIQLQDFEINEHDKANAENKNTKNEVDKFYKGQKLLLRHLLLDFIFDIQHSTIFQACPYFNKAHQLLKENLFFEAITAKANFYYWIERFNYHKKTCNTNKEILKLCKNELFKARERWLEIIQKPNADKFITRKFSRNLVFNKGTKNHINSLVTIIKLILKYMKGYVLELLPGNILYTKNGIMYWFNNIENELLRTYRRSEFILDRKKYFKYILNFIRYERRNSSLWLIERYSIIKAQRIVLGRFNIILNLIISCILIIYLTDFKFESNILINVLIRINLLFLVFISISSFVALLRIKLSFTVFFKLILFNLIILITSAWFFVFDLDTLRGFLFYEEASKKVYIIFFSFVGLSIAFIYSIEREERRIKSNLNSFLKGSVLFIIAFFYSFSINLIGTSLFANERLPQEYFLEKFWTDQVELDSIFKFDQNLQFEYGDSVLKKMKSSSYDFFVHNFKESADTIRIDSVFPSATLILAQLKYFIKSPDSILIEIPDTSKKNKYSNRKITLEKDSFIASYEIANLKKNTGINKITRKLSRKSFEIYKDEVLFDYLVFVNLPNSKQKVKYTVSISSFKIDVFPSMLLINTVLSLFIGIFIQLIINRKRLTDN